MSLILFQVDIWDLLKIAPDLIFDIETQNKETEKPLSIGALIEQILEFLKKTKRAKGNNIHKRSRVSRVI